MDYFYFTTFRTSSTRFWEVIWRCLAQWESKTPHAHRANCFEKEIQETDHQVHLTFWVVILFWDCDDDANTCFDSNKSPFTFSSQYYNHHSFYFKTNITIMNAIIYPVNTTLSCGLSNPPFPIHYDQTNSAQSIFQSSSPQIYRTHHDGMAF